MDSISARTPIAPPTRQGEMWRPSRFYPQLDGMRAFAVILVLMVHMDDMWLPAPLAYLRSMGWIGVDAFFVLSGFLITNILLSRKPSPRSFGIFVMRRTLRTWPLYFVTLFIAFLSLRHTATGALIHWPQYVFFLQNYAPTFVARSLGPTWSLCVEEHFYLIWPFVVFLLPRRALLWCVVVTIAVLPALRWLGLNAGFDYKQLYTETQFHLDGLMAGSLIAVMLSRFEFRRRTLARLGLLAFLIGAIASAAGFWNSWNIQLGSNVIFGFTSVSTAFAGVLLLLLARDTSLLSRMLSLAPVQYIGRISYGIYLLHDGTLALWKRILASLHLDWINQYWYLSLTLRFVLMIAIAAASFQFFESRVLRLKDRIRYTDARTKVAA